MIFIESGDTISADGEYGIRLGRTGWHRVQVGGSASASFGGGTATVKQEGHAYDGLSAISARATKVCCLQEGIVTIDVTGSTTPTLQVFVNPLKL